MAVISDFGELSAVNKFEVNDNTKINEPLSSIELNKEKSIQNALSDTLAFKQQPTASAPKTNENDKFFEQGTVNSKRLDNKAKSKPIFYPGLINDTYGNSIPYATIINLSNQVSVSSSLTGYFNIPVEEDSLVLLDVSAPGFTPREFRLNRFTKNNTLTLYEVPAEEEEGIITVSAELYDPLYSNLKITDLPEPENGWLLFNEYLRNKLTEKKETLKRGTVILEFNINNINRPSMIKVIKSLTPECNEEAIRLLKDGPRWKIKGKTKDINLMFRFY